MSGLYDVVTEAAGSLSRRPSGVEPRYRATLITHRFALEEAPEAFCVADRRADAIKVIVEP